LNATGYTGGVWNPAGIPLSSAANASLLSAAGCSFSNSDWNYSLYARRDIAYIKDQDAYGNSLADRGLVPPLDRFQGGHYSGHIRPDTPRNTRWEAFNAADSMATSIRNDPNYTTVIYTIGLQGNEPMAMDQDFMKRLANDGSYPPATNYDPTKPAGKFILANNTAEISQAFQEIASQILRLSK
jgi:hypothetical protein